MDNMPWVSLFNTFVPEYLISIVLFYLFSFLFTFFHMVYFDHVFPSPSGSPIPPHPYPLNFLFFLSVNFNSLYKEFNLTRKKKKQIFWDLQSCQAQADLVLTFLNPNTLQRLSQLYCVPWPEATLWFWEHIVGKAASPSVQENAGQELASKQ